MTTGLTYGTNHLPDGGGQDMAFALARRLLVVDDEPGNTSALVRLFTRAGFDARPADGGAEALAALATDAPPHVVLLDLMMPDVDGFDVLRAVRADRRYDGTAVVMYTAAQGAEVCGRAAGLGAQGCVAKGVPFAELAAEVRRYVA